MNGAFDFNGKTVFVAGGTSGINLGIADAFAAAGAKVAVMSRSRDNLISALTHLSRHRGKVFGETADVRDYPAVEEVIGRASAELGPIDVLVSGAAGNFLVEALNLSPNGFKSVVDIDLNGTFHVLKAAHPFLRKPGASIITISAPQSYNPAPMQVHACAAKAGMDQLMRVLALEWGSHGIRVNSIVPGPIANTGGLQKLTTEKERISMARRVPVGRLGDVVDIASMALFLGSPLASFITGALIPVDGGISLLGGRAHAVADEA